jgi:hypothetical protein
MNNLCEDSVEDGMPVWHQCRKTVSATVRNVARLPQIQPRSTVFSGLNALNVKPNLRISGLHSGGPRMRNHKSGPPELVLLIVVILLLLHPEQQTGIAQPRPIAEIRGTVTITRKIEPDRRPGAIAERYPGHGSFDATSAGNAEKPSEMKLSERSVVYLENDLLNRGKYPPPEKNPILDQKGLQFHPQVLPILVGTTVDFPNRDNLFHNVFSYSQPKEFDLGRYPKDDSRSVRFDRPGMVRVYCDIHAHMNATIMVLPHPYFATPADDGTYAIRNVPEGKYSLVLWVDRNIVERRSVEVRAGETLTVDFTH